MEDRVWVSQSRVHWESSGSTQGHGFSGLTGCRKLLLGLSDFSPGRRSWRIGFNGFSGLTGHWVMTLVGLPGLTHARVTGLSTTDGNHRRTASNRRKSRRKVTMENRVSPCSVWVTGRMGYGSSWFGSWVPPELLSSPEIDFWPPGIESQSSASSGSTVADPPTTTH
jgi:hypothetical protein